MVSNHYCRAYWFSLSSEKIKTTALMYKLYCILKLYIEHMGTENDGYLHWAELKTCTAVAKQLQLFIYPSESTCSLAVMLVQWLLHWVTDPEQAYRLALWNHYFYRTKHHFIKSSGAEIRRITTLLLAPVGFLHSCNCSCKASSLRCFQQWPHICLLQVQCRVNSPALYMMTQWDCPHSIVAEEKRRVLKEGVSQVVMQPLWLP